MGHPVEDVDSPVMEKGRLRDNPVRLGCADGATGQRFLLDLLHRLEAVSLAAFVFVERHREWLHKIILRKRPGAKGLDGQD